MSTISDIVSLCPLNLDFSVFGVTLAEVLTNFSLEWHIVPMHVSLDQVHNWAYVARQQRDVDVVRDNGWYIHCMVLTEFLQTDHLGLGNWWRRNGHLVILSVISFNLRNHQFCSLVIPVSGSVTFLAHADVWVGVCRCTSSPTWLYLGSIFLFSYQNKRLYLETRC